MKSPKKIAVAFALIIMLPLILLVGLQAFQQYTKSNIPHRFATEKLDTLFLTKGQVKWVEDGRELLIQSKLFDVESYTVQNGVVMVTGVYDEDETLILKFLSNLEEQDQQALLVQLLLLSQAFIICICFYRFQFRKNIALIHFIFFFLRKIFPALTKVYRPPQAFSF